VAAHHQKKAIASVAFLFAKMTAEAREAGGIVGIPE
jgi:hypothetical protein